MRGLPPPGRARVALRHLDRRQFLAASAASLLLPAVARASSGRRLVVVMAEGGWDVSFALDPKFDSDEVDGPEVDEDPDNPDDREALRTFGGIPIATNDFKRPNVTTFFENWHSRCTVVNGIWMGAIAHATARVRALTGTQLQSNPAWATIVGDHHGQDLPLGSIDLSGGSYAGTLAASTGQIGYQSQIQALVLDEASFPALPDAGYNLPQYRTDPADREALLAHHARRLADARLRWADGGHNDALINGRAEALARAARFRDEGSAALASLTLGAAPTLNEQVDLAVELLRTDLCRAVTLDSRQFWDTHDGNVSQHGNFDALFSGVNRLVGKLDEEGLLDDTLVAVISEFTRTPKLNSHAGKDHWPHASFLFAGCGVSASRVVGATDARIESLRVDYATGLADEGGTLVRYDNLAAGILASLNVDPERWFPTIQPFVGFVA